eukprot:5392340-Prymnesium_polylepis.1
MPSARGWSCLLALAVLADAARAAVPPLQLTGDTFYQEVASSDNRIFVFFHSPECGHCRAMMPTWEAFGEAAPSARLASLDVTEAAEIATRFEVYGYPTLLLLDPADGRMFEFRGDRT